MLDTNWGPWTEWTGGEPPVPNGTLIEALVMVRVQDLHRAKPPHFNHIIFRTGNGDSFRLKPLINNPKECLTLVYRYRAWQDGSTIHSEMPAEEAVPLKGVVAEGVHGDPVRRAMDLRHLVGSRRTKPQSGGGEIPKGWALRLPRYRFG